MTSAVIMRLCSQYEMVVQPRVLSLALPAYRECNPLLGYLQVINFMPTLQLVGPLIAQGLEMSLPQFSISDITKFVESYPTDDSMFEQLKGVAGKAVRM